MNGYEITSNAYDKKMINIFISYSREDENFKENLECHLASIWRQSNIEMWSKKEIIAGEYKNTKILEKIEKSQIILILVSSSYMGDNDCYDRELSRAIEVYKSGRSQLLPIILRPVDFRGTIFEELSLLPSNNKAITSWDNMDEALRNVVQGIRNSINKVEKECKPISKNLEFTVGPISLKSNLYISRFKIEKKCFDEIVNPGCLIRIKSPQQMGKTSLLIRLLDYSKRKNLRVIFLKLRRADPEIFNSLKSFFQWLCLSLEKKIGLESGIREFWSRNSLGNKQKVSDYIEGNFLSRYREPMVIILDDLDEIFKYPNIAENFLILLREWHEESKIYPIWGNLRIVISHSSENFPKLGIDQSPFNVGIPIDLNEFDISQVCELSNKFSHSLSELQIRQLMKMLGGHPYLLSVAFYKIKTEEIDFTDFLNIAPTDEGPYYAHLRRHWLNLKMYNLTQIMRRISESDEGAPIEIGKNDAFKLKNMGLIKFKGNSVAPLFDLYRLYFRDCLWN